MLWRIGAKETTFFGIKKSKKILILGRNIFAAPTNTNSRGLFHKTFSAVP
jgi:hypothetical protein